MHFDQHLLSLLNDCPDSSEKLVRLRKKSPLKSELEKVNIVANRYSTVDFATFSDFSTIKSIVDKLRTSSQKKASSEGDIVPILNTDNASPSDLRALLFLFTSDVPEAASKQEMIQMLCKYIPVTAVQAPPTTKPPSGGSQCSNCGHKPGWFSKKLSACYWCSRKFCSECPLGSFQYPRIGSTSHALCVECAESIARADIKDWTEASKKCFDDDSIMALLGCCSVAIALGGDAIDLLRSTARQLHAHGVNELAYNIIALANELSDSKATSNQQIKVYLLSSSILKSLAEDSTKSCEERLSFAYASKIAYLNAVSIDTESDKGFSVNRTKELDALVMSILDEITSRHNRKIMQYTKQLEVLWGQRDVISMLSFLKEMSTDNNDSAAILSEDASLKAFQDFLRNKEPFLSAMIPDDRHSLKFLMGIMKLREEEFEASLASFESSAWKSHHSQVPREVIVSAYLYLASEQHDRLYSYRSLKDLFRSGSNSLLFTHSRKKEQADRSFNLFFPSDMELSPPFKPNWPSLSIVDHNTRCHEKYEKAVLNLHSTKKWNNRRVAWAFIDEIAGCEHPAEIVVCHLHAAMWIAKEFEFKPKIEHSTLFGLKWVTMKLLKVAHAYAMLGLNPGMELYALRIIIGIVRKIALVDNSRILLTDEDTTFLEVVFERILKVSKLFPFWQPPMVAVSEAVMFNVVTRNLFCSFILELQTLNPTNQPITSLELKYQLYECNLRGFLPLENPSDTQSRAMEELLKSQNWSWSDVVHTMSSPLSPRDADGWLIQSPHLGIQQEYSELAGFVVDIDPDHPSVKLFVVEADPRKGRAGLLFSQEDINTFLQLDHSDFPLFFSLDAPENNLEKRFHPFQQWRYPTEKVKDTKVLSTIFTTDYLMKSFTVGSDVSSRPPFLQRPCKEGLTKNLPPELQEAIRSIEERGGIHSQSTHRFWIEAKEMKYKHEQKGTKIEFRFGEMEMIVKSHSLIRRTDGELKDTDDEDDPESPHARFAKDMTDHYDELGLYFPEFARLRELSKLQTLALMLQSILKAMKENGEGKGVTIPAELVTEIQEEAKKSHRTNVSEGLSKLKSEIGSWPTANNHFLVQSKVEEIKSDIYRQMNEEEDRLRRVHGYGITIDNSDAMGLLGDVESKVYAAFRSNDESVLSELTKALKGSANISDEYGLKCRVRDWLSSDNSRFLASPREALLKFVCSHLPIPTHADILKSVVDQNRRRYQALANVVNGYKGRSNQTPSSCKWVPAAIAQNSRSITYGGVAFVPKLVEVSGRIPNVHGRIVIADIRGRPWSAPKPPQVSYTAPKGIAVVKSTDNKPSSNSSSSNSSGSSSNNPSNNSSNNSSSSNSKGSSSNSGNGDTSGTGSGKRSSSSDGRGTSGGRSGKASTAFPKEAAAAAAAMDDSNKKPTTRKDIEAIAKGSCAKNQPSANVFKKTPLNTRQRSLQRFIAESSRWSI